MLVHANGTDDRKGEEAKRKLPWAPPPLPVFPEEGVAWRAREKVAGRQRSAAAAAGWEMWWGRNTW